jgi:hypothetical protein
MALSLCGATMAMNAICKLLLACYFLLWNITRPHVQFFLFFLFGNFLLHITTLFSYSSLPALLYYAQHCYTEQDEVDIALLKRNFEGICGAGFDDWIMASKVNPHTNTFCIKLARFFFINMNCSIWHTCWVLFLG